MLVAIVLSAFCPYLMLSMGLRVDHIVIYGLLYVAIMRFLAQRQPIERSITLLLLGWSVPVVIILTRTFLDDHVPFSQMFADLDNFLQPIALLTCLMFLFHNKDPKSLLMSVCNMAVWMLFINAVWTCIGVAGFDTTSINQYFWRSHVAALAATNGRFSGIFNQPMEAGVAYSLALFGWAYLAHYQTITKRKVVALLGLLVGGLLTVSKLFLFGGLPLFLWWAFKEKMIRRNFVKIAAVGIIVGIIPYHFLTREWSGMNYMLRFFSSPGSWVDLLTAGRYGGVEEAQQTRLFQSVWNVDPIFGLGLGRTTMVDSGYFQMFANGGLLALGGYIFFLVCVVWLMIRNWKRTPESILLRCLTLIVVVGSFGGPMLTLNRCSILLWCMLCCTLLVMNRETGSFYLR